MTAGGLDCTTCGACCRDAGEVVLRHDEDVPRRLTRSVRGVVGFASWEAEDFRRMARRPDDGCAALAGEVGGTCSCRIYARRPEVCRLFAPGSEDCSVARTKAGLVSVRP